MLNQEQIRELPHIERYDELEANIPYRVLVSYQDLVEYYTLLHNQNKFRWIAVSVNFKSTRDTYTRNECESEYESKVLYKIKKRIKRNHKFNENLIPIVDEFYFEKEQKSKTKFNLHKNPKHIHAMVPIPYEFIGKIWDESKSQPDLRLIHDIKSLHTIDQVFIEPVRLDEMIKWVCYIRKQKGVFKN